MSLQGWRPTKKYLNQIKYFCKTNYTYDWSDIGQDCEAMEQDGGVCLTESNDSVDEQDQDCCKYYYNQIIVRLCS